MKENKLKFNIASVFLVLAFIYGIVYSCLLKKVVYDSTTESYILKLVVDTFYLPISLLALATAVTIMFEKDVFKYISAGLIFVMAGIQYFLFGEYLYNYLYYSAEFYWIGYGIFSLIAGLGITYLGIMYLDFKFEKLKVLRKFWYIPLALIALKFVFNIVILIIYEPLYGEVENGSLTVNIWGPKTVDLLLMAGYALTLIPFVPAKQTLESKTDDFYGFEYTQPQPIKDEEPAEKVDTQLVDRPTRRTTTRINVEPQVQVQPRTTSRTTTKVDLDSTTQVPPRTTSRTTTKVNVDPQVQVQPRTTSRTTTRINVEAQSQQEQPRRGRETSSIKMPNQNVQNEQQNYGNQYRQNPYIQANQRNVPPYYQQQKRGANPVNPNQFRQPNRAPVSEIQALQQQLTKLKGMLDAGLITQEDYDRIKQQIMKI